MCQRANASDKRQTTLQQGLRIFELTRDIQGVAELLQCMSGVEIDFPGDFRRLPDPPPIDAKVTEVGQFN